MIAASRQLCSGLLTINYWHKPTQHDPLIKHTVITKGHYVVS